MLTAVRQRIGRRVTVNVDEAGRDEHPARVDLIRRRPGRRSPIATMQSVPDRDVGVESRIAAAVEDGAVPDDRVERRGLPVGHRAGRENEEDQSFHRAPLYYARYDELLQIAGEVASRSGSA